MADQQLSAPPRARYVVRRSSAGVTKKHEAQRRRFTIIGNHLAQHGQLSLTAIGLATHIQSLPEGAPVDILTLSAKFPEGRTRVAAALRELEAYGYIERVRERTAGGRIITRTISYNHPEATRAAGKAGAPAPEAPQGTVVPPVREPVPVADGPAAPPRAPTPDAVAAARPTPPPLPAPSVPSAERLRTATQLLAGLRRTAPLLLLSERQIRRLASAVEAWLERGATPDAVCHTLTSDLPAGLRHPAGLLAHRLTEQLPPPLPTARLTTRPDPLQNCEDCDRAYRAPEPGKCPGCAGPDRPEESPPPLAR
ncbi:helix-turn-helix domain-containing protein [Streptomyces niveus]|uniref:helix-turn-helix domain-containing protein n=1 Tax=Streptomyces niveus TaxID=193462 RepID=UPI00343C28EF